MFLKVWQYIFHKSIYISQCWYEYIRYLFINFLAVLVYEILHLCQTENILENWLIKQQKTYITWFTHCRLPMTMLSIYKLPKQKRNWFEQRFNNQVCQMCVLSPLYMREKEMARNQHVFTSSGVLIMQRLIKNVSFLPFLLTSHLQA